ncbi:hypothetical protein EV13_2783 [Prochlorococcus sp. MIT 0702]|nr:hypothetical protein EV12_2735 [Prochlorococcus sp. MIT 0701]KGG26007.1 hypothetical protein EV13_2783 [Prochlorococcus sp. MIT 0702]KGG30813.1 hypothetical protein EV14_2750 [Prochlorococcus sp. MIT 0703]
MTVNVATHSIGFELTTLTLMLLIKAASMDQKGCVDFLA